jgi:hypothetical protein
MNSNEMKVKMAAFKVGFLMPHQEVVPDLEIEALQIRPIGEINKESDDYLAGAYDALSFLIAVLKDKGFQ